MSSLMDKLLQIFKSSNNGSYPMTVHYSFVLTDLWLVFGGCSFSRNLVETTAQQTLTSKQGQHRSSVDLTNTPRLWHLPLLFGFFYSAFVIALVSHDDNCCVYLDVFMNCEEYVCFNDESIIMNARCLKVFVTYYWNCRFQFKTNYIIID